MEKRDYSLKNSYKKSEKKFNIKKMKPGSDKSLKRVFKKIGVPGKAKFKPDAFQLQAIKAIEKSDCLVTAPTGSGKTWIAQEVAKKVMQKKGRVWYATPLKALTNSIHAKFVELFNEENVGILTGDIKENPDASIVIGTTEILRNQLYDAMHTGENLNCDLIILDEAHFLGDEQRGVVWEEIMIYLPIRIPLLLLSATIGNPFQIAKWLEAIRGQKCHVVESNDRPVPLFPLFMHPSGTLFPLMQNQGFEKKQELHKKVLKFEKTGRKPKMAPFGKLPPFADILEILDRYNLLPAIFFLKSRKDCDQAIKLCNSSLLSRNPEKKRILTTKINDLVSGNPHLANHSQRLYLEQTACASHHSGHLPAWKVVVETLMSQGFLNAMFATSTVAAGVNFPARSVVVLNSDRFNGVEFMGLSPSEFQQMTGRAGRRGMDKIGFAIMMPGKFMDLKYVANLINSPALDIESQITINFSMVLNLLLSHTPDQIKMLLEKSFASHLIMSKKKRGKKARKKFGYELEFLWNSFLGHMDFLIQENFVTRSGKLTQDGLWASNLRIDSPLLVAQSIRKNLLPQKDPALLAAIIGSFVNEKEFKDDILYSKALPKRLKDAFLHAREGLKPFAIKMLKKGFHAPNLFMQPSLLLYSWAHDEPWDNIVTHPEYGPGDFARLTMRTADNLRQISKLDETFPDISRTAKEAITLILRDPVVTS
ncbi:MAG: DEAD/DEAH box helicase [Deltaproteobacteria bacterium]|jgi:ATP-dependent RNA helicase HelY|nr:DEAD/DEAH box helicase [Deltaproteobacteria bacterium]